MTAVHLGNVVRHLRGVLARSASGGLTDADLLQRYARARDEAAFEALVRKHGPMVLGVCRRILRQEQDAEDAFQATFLVLVRKAASLRSPHSLGNWLYGVARRTALAARSAATRRREREATRLPRAAPPEDLADLRPVLDQELGGLPERYRSAVVLCDLQGLPRKEAAHQLGWAEGTVASRLARGRNLLARRLARRGFAGAVVTTALANEAAPAAVPNALLRSTLSSLSAARGAGVLSSSVAGLMEGVLKTMFLMRLKTALAVSLAIALVAAGSGAWIWGGPAAQPATGSDAKPQPANRAALQDQVQALKRQLARMQQEIDRVEQQVQPPPEDQMPRDSSLGRRFKYRVPFEVGSTESKEGGRIEILEVWGTRPRIEVGGQYVVRGKYVLPPGQHGKLYFYQTSTGNWGREPTATLDLQTVTLEQERGEFTLLHGMLGPGWFHLYLASPDRYSRMFANVYFGTGDNVLRKLPWKASE
jgi:RNA polymerase sigma factor (sigma-70 family)